MYYIIIKWKVMVHASISCNSMYIHHLFEKKAETKTIFHVIVQNKCYMIRILILYLLYDESWNNVKVFNIWSGRIGNVNPTGWWIPEKRKI